MSKELFYKIHPFYKSKLFNKILSEETKFRYGKFKYFKSTLYNSVIKKAKIGKARNKLKISKKLLFFILKNLKEI